MRASLVIDCLERTAPPGYAASWDKCGVMLAAHREEITHLAVTLDPTPEAVNKALERGADFILAHHPLALTPRLPDKLDNYHYVLKRLFQADCWLYAAHTSLDCQPSGPVGWLARHFRLGGLRLLEPTAQETLISVRITPVGPKKAELARKLSTGVRALGLSLEADGSLLFTAGESRFEPRLAELKAHPELTSGFELGEPRRFTRDLGFGLCGDLPKPMAFKDFCHELRKACQRDDFRMVGPAPAVVSRVAYCPGSGSSLIREALALGAQVYITGDVKYHEALESPLELALLDVGHFCLEELMMSEFASLLNQELSPFGVKVSFISGRDPFVFHCPAK